MTPQQFNSDLLAFLTAATTPFHAVAALVGRLEAAGFTRLPAEGEWNLQPGQCCYLTRNDSSLLAFTVGSDSAPETGMRMVGAHTDSPCLMVKPAPEKQRSGYFQLGVEVYGGALLNPWFDRDLSLAGRVSFADAEGALHTALVDFRRPLAVIPRPTSPAASTRKPISCLSWRCRLTPRCPIFAACCASACWKNIRTAVSTGYWTTSCVFTTASVRPWWGCGRSLSPRRGWTIC